MVNRRYLDYVDGWYGDRFICGMLDAFPQFKKGLAPVIADARERLADTVTGERFTVTTTLGVRRETINDQQGNPVETRGGRAGRRKTLSSKSIQSIKGLYCKRGNG